MKLHIKKEYFCVLSHLKFTKNKNFSINIFLLFMNL